MPSLLDQSNPDRQSDISSSTSALAAGLLQAGCARFGSFTLKSGVHAPFIIDMRTLVSHPPVLLDVARAYLPILHQLEFDHLGAIPYAGLPIATTISLLTGWPMIYPRKEVKGYGPRAEIEGEFKSGDRVVMIDDLATTGVSKFEAMEKLWNRGLQVKDVVVLIDRQAGASSALSGSGVRLHAVCTINSLLDAWETAQSVPPEQIAAARFFLKEHG